MNAAVLMESCPDPETVSAFIDQRLDPNSRLEVVKHLAECGDCRDLVVAAREYRAENEAPGGDVWRGRFGSRWIAPLGAAAAVVAVLFGVPSMRQRILPKSEMEELVALGDSLPKRTTAARLSGDFAYKPYSNPRGSEETELLVELAAAEAAARAEKSPSTSNLHELGIASVLDKKANDAVAALERAARETSSPEILTDLSAAYIARGDYDLAYATAARAFAMKQTPAAAWNIALALQYHRGRDAEARRAWERYLRLDPDSEWAAEARTHLADLLE